MHDFKKGLSEIMWLFLFFLLPVQRHKQFFIFFSCFPQEPELHKSAWPESSVPRCLPLAKQRRQPFCCLWGVLRQLRAVIQQRMPLSAPHSEKANSPQGIDGMEERTEDDDLRVVGYYNYINKTISNLSFSKKQGQTGHKGSKL